MSEHIDVALEDRDFPFPPAFPESEPPGFLIKIKIN